MQRGSEKGPRCPRPSRARAGSLHRGHEIVWSCFFVMTDNNKLINQLRALALLTQTEEQVARTRISQARTDAVRRELTQNADNAANRSLGIVEQLRELGGVPDVVTPAIGRLSAILKA